MEKNFAIVDYVTTNDQIPIKFPLIKKSTPKVLDWYVRRFNPYRLEEVTIAGVGGVQLWLPLTKEEALGNEEKEKIIVEKNLLVIANERIPIVQFVPQHTVSMPPHLILADGKYLMAFYLVEAMTKVVKTMEKQMKKVEVVIVNGDLLLTEIILDLIYLDVNYVSVVVSQEEEDFFKEKALQLFEDSGLNINVVVSPQYVLKNADVVINTQTQLPKYDYFLKRGCIYFEFSNDMVRYKELMSRRPDLVMIDDFRIGYKEENYTTTTLALAFFHLCKEYQSIYKNRYQNAYRNRILKTIKFYGFSFQGLLCLNKIVQRWMLQKV